MLFTEVLRRGQILNFLKIERAGFIVGLNVACEKKSKNDPASWLVQLEGGVAIHQVRENCWGAS